MRSSVIFHRHAVSRIAHRVLTRTVTRGLAGSIVLLGGGFSAWAIVSPSELAIVDQLHDPLHVRTTQEELNGLVEAGAMAEAFTLAFERGDEIFGAVFNALDGSGANVGNGERYTHVPRADLTAATQWATHLPPRVTGPNAAACFECHNIPVDDGAGLASGNVHRDPFRTASLGQFINRNTPHLFGSGGVQRLAEEMSATLRAQVTTAIAECVGVGCTVTVTLEAKGVSFGTVGVTRTDPGDITLPPNNCDGTDAIPFIDPADCLAGLRADIRNLQGVGRDLVVRPFQWKGSIAFLRDFNRDASNQEIGMQSVELAGDDIDSDFDGVPNELGIGDQTALAVYIAGQARPTTRRELAALGLIPALAASEVAAIEAGAQHFGQIGCATCHTPSLTIDQATFSEPSQNPSFRDEIFPAGQDPIARGLDPARAVTFDLTRDLPDNRVVVDGVEVRFGSFESGEQAGSAIVRLYGDMKRHDMGPGLAEQVDEIGTGASVFLTENLWGVGSTPPYLHDGRATTLAEAILAHGGEAQASRDAFVALADPARQELINFLDDLVIFVLEGEEE